MKNNRRNKNTENMVELRKRCKDIIDSCTNLEQLKGAKKYIELAELHTDALTVAWYELKESILII